MPFLELHGVGRTLTRLDDRPLTILSGIDLSIEQGDRISVVGRSGSGKSTLLNLLGLLDSPTEGEIRLEGLDVSQFSNRRRDLTRGRDIGFVFQQFNLLHGRTALENVSTPLLYERGATFWKRTAIAAEMLERVGLGNRLSSTPVQLSGGEQQRVAVARALVRRPRLILADEPTGALDIETGETVMALLDEIATASNAALVTITHDPSIAARAHRQYTLEDGGLIARDLITPDLISRGPVTRAKLSGCNS
ncbi:ABC transporter ATP-binding protein [Cryobacterium algoricola]|uniref:ABC transporter ATP-binding protein n=1 Tax=Cryobacterium algoricola TaxID=1259183 RepID=A0ABY2IBL2_9MICO|nr:ABC transporter ATP-binding protein [Cryobacterium algoricola]TFB86853.1 ABC transporter ATP-binding protein [Cryobacterium algoricola]